MLVRETVMTHADGVDPDSKHVYCMGCQECGADVEVGCQACGADVEVISIAPHRG